MPPTSHLRIDIFISWGYSCEKGEDDKKNLLLSSGGFNPDDSWSHLLPSRYYKQEKKRKIPECLSHSYV
jgi:hypothetical protein